MRLLGRFSVVAFAPLLLLWGSTTRLECPLMEDSGEMVCSDGKHLHVAFLDLVMAVPRSWPAVRTRLDIRGQSHMLGQ